MKSFKEYIEESREIDFNFRKGEKVKVVNYDRDRDGEEVNKYMGDTGIVRSVDKISRDVHVKMDGAGKIVDFSGNNLQKI